MKMTNYTDFKIWSRLAPDEETRLPKINDCKLELVEQREVEPGEIPARILLSTGGIKWLYRFRISDYEDETSLGYARKFGVRLAEANEGVLEETGKELVWCVPHFIPPALTEYTPMLTLSVWFGKDKKFTDLYEDIVSILEREFPFAMPVKFGDNMPPDRDYTDRAAFIEFLKDTPQPVWYAQRPVTHVHVNDAERAEAKREGLRVNRISLCMPDEVYDIPEWKFALRRLLKSLTVATGGFFGQICRGNSGVVSWWWQGVPLELGVACTFGEPYWSLIADCADKGECIGEHIAYFEEPNGPLVPEELLSLPKRKLGRGRLYPDDFTIAPTLPVK